ncbi:MAG: hypothetical protein IPJ69_07250 [Deltaproteobacteria bacterium]|nr:MAG: hypothetical protein IPJ69_07250 [Deltaproteobacteria bacterium]
MNTIQIPSKIFMSLCFLISALLLWLGWGSPFGPEVVALEVFVTIISLFVFGSTKYRIDKNALTYGMGSVILATFWPQWWPQSSLKSNLSSQGGSALWDFIQHHLLTLHGLNELFHADTMLFILGLTFFVAVIVQTRLLESISFVILKKNKGLILPTIALITGIVSIASGILDGVSMIGIMIRVLVMLLFLARTDKENIVYIVMVSTIVTTVCGMWMAYGEPPNLIMKSNLHPHLNDAFFLRYCLPVAVGAYILVYFNIRKRLKNEKVDLKNMDILDVYTADVRFLQALRHGEVLIATECADFFKEKLGEAYSRVEAHLHAGIPFGTALLREDVPEVLRHEILGHFVSEELAEALDDHYVLMELHKNESFEEHEKNRALDAAEINIRKALEETQIKRKKAQKIGALAFLPFLAGLVSHAINHDIPLFVSSFAGFSAAILGVLPYEKLKKLSFKEGKHEYQEYLFLFPLFLSITLLQKTGFFAQLSTLLHAGIESLGHAHMAYLQFVGATFLSAVLDNNVVADFAGRAIYGLEITVIHLFAMAQIAGYAAGGCWTHIGSAQSVVSYAFITREVDPHYTPFQWIKAMTPLILEIFILMTVVVYGEALLLKYLG